MMVIRPVEQGDLAGLLTLAGETGGGLTSLPADAATLAARIAAASLAPSPTIAQTVPVRSRVCTICTLFSGDIRAKITRSCTAAS